jgi:hypothetical protein
MSNDPVRDQLIVALLVARASLLTNCNSRVAPTVMVVDAALRQAGASVPPQPEKKTNA